MCEQQCRALCKVEAKKMNIMCEPQYRAPRKVEAKAVPRNKESANYAKYIKRMRDAGEHLIREQEAKKKGNPDGVKVEFFLRSQRRSLLKTVERRVDLCLASYEEDLNKKRARLLKLFETEEEENVRSLIKKAQAGEELLWQEKMERLKYLLEKRQKEHEEKFKDLPISKCVHALPCIIQMRCKEAQQYQLYQMKEKEARRMSEKEFDKMWHAIIMKKTEALEARLEYDAIERLRRDKECAGFAQYQIEQNKINKEKEKEMLKQEQLYLKSIWDADIRQEKEEQRLRREKNMEIGRNMVQCMKDQAEISAKRAAEEKVIADTWDSLTSQGLADELAKIEMAKKKERDNDECNRRMIELKRELESMANDNEEIIKEEFRKAQKIQDNKRCEYLLWSQKTNRDVRQAMVEQIKERQEACKALAKKMQEEDLYQKQLRDQLDKLVANKSRQDAEERKRYQKQLLDQIEYSRIMKERARQEELEQLKKFEIAAKEYQDQIKEMLCRPFYSEGMHPFMKQMARGLKMKDECPCSKPNYCK